MKPNMRFKRYTQIFYVILALLVCGAGEAWAQVTASDIFIQVMPSGKEGNGSVTDATYGSVSASVGTLADGKYPVTLTVTPASGYKTKTAMIVAEKMVNPDRSSARRRTPGMGTFPVTGPDTDPDGWKTSATEYTFYVTSDYDGAYVTVTFVSTSISATPISSLNEITASGNFVLTRDVDASSLPDGFPTEFTGTLDGNYHKIYNLSEPLFTSINGGKVKNIIFENVNITSGDSDGDAGAVCSKATGAARIYNCGILPVSTNYDNDGNITGFSGSSVGGSGNVGGLVGTLSGTARVINCFSYANITGGTTVGGIVGNNSETTTASSADNLKTMVMNCMFYGNISGGSIAPIYNGTIITNVGQNSGISNYNYFWEGASYVKNINVYNCALSAETRYLQHFEFYRHLLNGHRELAAWWATGSLDNKAQMMKWVLEPSQIGSNVPFPILKTPGYYPSVVNIDAANAEAIDANNEHYNEGRKLTSMGTDGQLAVTIQMGTNAPFDKPTGAGLKSAQSSTTIYLNITDKDPQHFNFNYGKVQLPYYNDYGTGNYTQASDNTYRVVTGWKVTVSGGTNSFTTGEDAAADADGKITSSPYNFADRNCTEKDDYNTSGRVFSQGAYFDVPEGVTSITIEPYWAKAVFLSDENPDVVYNLAMSTKYNVPYVGEGKRYNNGNYYNFTDIDGNTINLRVYTSIGNAVTALSPSGTVYDNAIVLVGNAHNIGISSTNQAEPYTIMSADFDHDNEPDYSYILRFNDRVRVHPVRVDFINIPGLGMAQKSTGGQGTYNLGIMQPYGWFESTNTSLFRLTQFEYDYAGDVSDPKPRANSPMILQGGMIEQWVTAGAKETKYKAANSVTYYHVGGNVWFKEFHLGVHQDKTQDEFVTPHPPISVTGGDFNEFYLTGLYNTPNANYDDNAECYINGGRFGKVAGTGMQGIGGFTMTGSTKTGYSNGNIIWQIDNADIDEFYAGGINAAHIAEGNITTVISNSRVDLFCGGPKFGDMNPDKKVVTNATNCTFRAFFGAGYGGNSYNRRYPDNYYQQYNYDWNTWLAQQYTKIYDSKFKGVETRIDYQFIPRSNNVENVARLFVDYVSFSLATTYDVTSKLTGCTITKDPLGRLELFDGCLGNFYGGGSLGKVTGDVKSTLTNCTVDGNVFGAGYSASLPNVSVMANSFQSVPSYDVNTGAYHEAVLPATTSYKWVHRDVVNSTATAIDETNHILYTTEDLTTLGTVTGKATLNIEGTTTVAGNVYGGGEESDVTGNTEVNISGGSIAQNVFGGGKGDDEDFECLKAMVGVNNAGACADLDAEENKNKGTKVIISNGTVNGDVYGGGEIGRVEWNTQVTIGDGEGVTSGDPTSAPVVNGSVFGAGKGLETHGYSALVRGNSTVTVQGNAKVRENVYGGGENATVGRYWVKDIPADLCDDIGETRPEAPDDLPTGMPYKQRRGGKCKVFIQGQAQVGPDEGGATATTGHVFGAGKGVEPHFNASTSKKMTKNDGLVTFTADNGKTAEQLYLEFLQTLALVTNSSVTIDGGAKVKGSVYGGSESGFVQNDTKVEVKGSTCVIGTASGTTNTYGDVYGGGKGLTNFAEAGIVKGTTKVEIKAGTAYGNVYGGGELGDVGTHTQIPNDNIGNYNWFDADGAANTTANADEKNTGVCTVAITGGAIGTTGVTMSADGLFANGNVFGGGKGDNTTFWCQKAMVYSTDVTVDGNAIVNGSVYGGGEIGRVEDNSVVKIGDGVGVAPGTTPTSAPDIKGNVFGAGKGLKTHGYSALVRGNVTLTVEGNAKVRHSVYGGGQIASVGRHKVKIANGTPPTPPDAPADLPVGMPYTLDGTNVGECTVNIQGYAEITNDVFGAGQGLGASHYVYNSSFQRMGMSGWESLTEDVYFTFLQTLALTTDTDVDISGNAKVKGSVYGGSENGFVQFNTDVSIQGSCEIGVEGTTTEGNVYGGGRGISGNTIAGPVSGNTKVTIGGGTTWGNVFGGGAYGVVKESVEVNVTGGEVKKDVYGGGALANTNTANWTGTALVATAPYHVVNDLKVGTSVVTGLYTESSGTYTKITAANTPAASGTTYYRLADTQVNLTGGYIYGDAYGGGLGRRASQDVTAVPAMVYSDVHVNLGNASSATRFFISNYDDKEGTEYDESIIVKSGRVFGCNNLNGSPLGNVTVTVNKTVAGNVTRTTAGSDGKAPRQVSSSTHYEVAAVYGGGNLADNTAATGKKTHVIINGCNDTSIREVYGGGNAAAVPETDVDINAAYEIGSVFGGGNGKDPYTLDGGSSWTNNSGADVNGPATTVLSGGTIHEAFGGSNMRGTISGTVSINTSTNADCALRLGKLYGAGKNADIEGDLIVTLGCMPGEENPTDEVYGGAENANVKGDVELTITSGSFGKVFGGNNTSGAIFGHIKLNIEETGCCPIQIDELYLGGYNAAYSVYGYKNTAGEGEDPVYVARTTSTDGTAVHFGDGSSSDHTKAPYDDPELNIISCTRIGKVFGGGLGDGAVIYGNPTVNINQIYGIKSDGSGGYTAKATTLGAIGGQYTLNGETVDGGVFGGGNQASVIGNTTLNIGSLTEVDPVTTPVDQTANESGNYDVMGANIVCNVYGGGNLADVGKYHEVTDPTTGAVSDVIDAVGNTFVNIGAKENTSTDEFESVTLVASGAAVTVNGDVFGGGKGVEDSFRCGKAMVTGGTNIHIGNGTVNGTVYGGGQVGRVEGNTAVTIGETSGTSAPVIRDDVFGAGKGVETHGYSALVRGKTNVTIQGNATVGHSVYGGGELASVGRFKVKTPASTDAPEWLPIGMPYSLWDATTESGKCTVVVQGNAVIGPDGMTMTATGGPVDFGHVFGAGRGLTPEIYAYNKDDYQNTMPKRMMAYDPSRYKETYADNEDKIYWEYHSPTDHDNVWEYFDTEAKYLTFVETMALANKTDVTIDGSAFVKGSVYGGSENGQVKHDTYVKIKGGQIGEGQGMTAPYASGVFINPATTPVAASVATCATWTYVNNGYTYDKYADADGNYSYTGKFAVIPEAERLTSTATSDASKGGRPTATDGHTFYGNVFAGGSGYYPYAPGKWHSKAGVVGGNTRVDIEGGHILSNVYGGNEQTDVGSYSTDSNGAPQIEEGGTCRVNMKGGTVGVPRTAEDIANKPVIGNIFGAGKGDKRVLFNTKTNVKETFVNITGGIVYGSVFGGGEDGHVMGDATTTIVETDGDITIGSTGESGADGNVFAGGRGSETALTAGVVGGNTSLTISSGTILGSVYGGGRLASVGTNFVNPNISSLYGQLQSPAADHGNTTITITGGTIGTTTSTSGISGNIFGASKGTTTDFRLGIVRSTTISMSGGTANASVYGGGELAQVVGSHTTSDKVLGTEINITGGTVGQSGKGAATWGNVYGGGKGNTTNLEAGLVKTNTLVNISQAANKTTKIWHNVYGGGAYGSVGTFTRADDAYHTQHSTVPVGTVIGRETANTGITYVTITGGTIGSTGQNNGMVFGSSRGDVGAPGEIHDRLAWVYDTHVTIGDADGGPAIKGSIYGSGENGHTYHNAVVNVHGGTIGIESGDNVVVTNDDNTTTTYTAYNYPYRGNVYGGGCGTDKYYSSPSLITGTHTATDGGGDKYNYLAGIVLGNATVTIDGGHVVRNVYGAGAMGSVGTITNYDELDDATKGYKHKTPSTDGKESYYDFGLSWPYKFEYDNTTGLASVTIKGNAIIGVTYDDAKGGHVFGAARGAVNVGANDIEVQRYEEVKLANVREATVVIGEESGTATTPTIRGSVYGGGEDGHVYDNATVTIHHGTIAHSVFGGGKGESTFKAAELWTVDPSNENSHLTLADQNVHSWIAGKVFGNTEVTMNGGSVGYSIYGGGNLASVGKGNYTGGSDDYSTAGYGELGEKQNDGSGGPIWTANPTNGTYPYYFANSGKATVTIKGGTLGTAGVLYDNLPTGNVFGGSRGKAAASVQKSPRYRYVPDFFLGYVNETEVNIGGTTGDGPKVYGSVYGGGQDGHVRRGTNIIMNRGTIGDAGESRGGNIFGSGSGVGTYNDGTEKCNNSSGSVTCTTTITVNNGQIIGSVYGGGSLASVGPPHTGQGFDEYKAASGDHKSYSFTQVNIKGGTIGGSVYGASRGPHSNMSDVVKAFINSADYDATKFATILWSDVNISGAPTISGSVYGGGEKGLVKHATNVNIGIPAVGETAAIPFTGTISQDVFGGGKEAVVGGNVTVNLNSGTVNQSVYGGGALAHTNVNKTTETLVLTGAKATTDEANATTTVNLYGGIIKGDAYGGGLGQKDGFNGKSGDIDAVVWGDINVNLGSSGGSTATAFYLTNYDAPHADVVKSGRIFGCNNLMGSPRGDVKVTVYRTVNGYDSEGNRVLRTAITRDDDGNITSIATPHTYQVAAVYGGGNLADYTAIGKTAYVRIETCEVSVRDVYGGGNAAEVPATDVLVRGAYEIEEVFGGGNGKDQYTNGSTWLDNPGANVGNSTTPGNATTLLTGGYVHEAYGGSNKKGTIYGNVSIDMGEGSVADNTNGACTLEVEKLVGAGKDADVNGDLIMIMGCKPNVKTPVLYAGADNANVNGDVELTITSGKFGKVFGGNNQGGIIMGHIKLNIEETGDCDVPIEIDELYLGGNQAMYSMYGYYKDDNTYKARTAEMAAITDPAATGYTPAVTTEQYGAVIRKPAPYDAPVLNVISCTRIGRVYGGGYGSGATLYGNPIVNINMIPGSKAALIDRDATPGADGNANLLGAIGGRYTNADGVEVDGGVFGGGDGAEIRGNTTVNIGTAETVDMNTEPLHLGAKGTAYQEITLTGGKKVYRVPVRGAYIVGNVYGGGNLANVGNTELGTDKDGNTIDVINMYCNTSVNICAMKGTGDTYSSVTFAEGAPGVTINGSVYGGGKGQAINDNTVDAFRCGKAMVTNNTNVIIGNGTVKGSVYGGGEVGRVEVDTRVTIGIKLGDGEGVSSTVNAPVIEGNVFGAGAGKETHGYSALVRGDSYVTVQGNAKVEKSVYGGGEKASVGRHKVENGIATDVLGGGKCTVIIQDNAEIGTNDMVMVTESGYPNDAGHVFGAGKGVLPYEGYTSSQNPWSTVPGSSVTYTSANEADYFKFINTLALATNTEVTIGGNAFVKGSVFGGSENGHVQTNTHVTIQDKCQIGNGYIVIKNTDGTIDYESCHGVNRRYTDAEWTAGQLSGFSDWTSASLPECASWEFDANDARPYNIYDYVDPTAETPVPKHAKDGHTFYGNVFGGGSGYYPYRQNPSWTAKASGSNEDAKGYADGLWHREAGSVGGNTVVDITGGHILTSVYGGNEQTDVTGTCTINMVGGTVGVPRTVEQAKAHPVTCYVFGAGKGDPRINFNQWTNVASTQVNITGNARVYGSTFGGGEDGHVLGDAVTNIGGDVTIGETEYSYPTSTTDPGVIIGTTGTSAVDGNIFGGGRGFSESALTAGVVGGNVSVNIYNGKMLGTVFGGGRLASVGTNLVEKYLPNSSTINSLYGAMNGGLTDLTHGIIRVNISGGTIGATDSDGKLVASTSSIGDVFGGCKGSSTNNLSFGLAKHTYITMTGGKVNGSVYGGGEVAIVEGSTTINISGGVVGDGVTVKGGEIIGNVFGGGKGNDADVRAGLIKGNTNVTISNTLADAAYAAAHEGVSAGDPIGGPTIYHNIYGGGAYGSVGTFDLSTDDNKTTYHVPYAGMPVNWTANTGTANVTITGGNIGSNGDENGMIFGSSRGDVGAPGEVHDKLAWVYNTNVTIGTSGQGFDAPQPQIKGSVYGSGENGHTSQNAVVNIHSGTIGITSGSTIGSYSGAAYPYRGNVYGGGCGTDKYDSDDDEVLDSYNPLAGIVYGNATVSIDGGRVVHNVYGAGAMGSVGTAGVATTGLTTISISGGTIGVDGTFDEGNVFGAARGKLSATGDNLAQVRETSVTVSSAGNVKGSVYGGGEAGLVKEKTTVSMSGGTVGKNVYGGGDLGSVGTYVVSADMRNFMWTNETNPNPASYTYNSTGVCNVTITGGKVGPDNNTDPEIGNVFGAGKGKDDTFWCEKGIVYRTNLTIKNTGTVVNGNVYGGGEVGRVEDDTKVEIGTEGGSDEPDIKGCVYGAGAGLSTHGYSALARGNSVVTIQGKAKIGGNVFGGGETASLGRFKLDEKKMPKEPDGGGSSTVTIRDDASIGLSVYGAGKGVTPDYKYSDSSDYNVRENNSKRMVTYDYDSESGEGRHQPGDEKKTWDYYPDNHAYVWEYYTSEADYLTYLKTLAIASNPTVTISGNANVNGDVYGGGQLGVTLGNVNVNINGGTVAQDVYGGGALADTNKGNWDDSQYVAVTGLTVGKSSVTGLYTRSGAGTEESPYSYTEITGTNALAADGITYYGKGKWATDKYNSTTYATTYTTNVTLTGGEIGRNVYGGGLGRKAQGDVTAVEAKVYGDVLVKLNETTASDDCIVKGSIFGCNNANGSPQSAVTVHVFKTEGYTGHMRTGNGLDATAEAAALVDPDDTKHTYELRAVYGGGNQAAFRPDYEATCDTVQPRVIIDGCDLTSIQTVYGGGNAASTPATNVLVNGTYEIEEVFGGGNGAGTMEDGSANPGANVGYYAYPKAYDPPASSKEERTERFRLGSGKANVNIVGGRIHRVFGGSNTKGNVRESAVTILQDMEGCHFIIDEAYGGGKNAPMDADAKLLMACIPGLKVAYGGARAADIQGDVELNITNGTFDRVFGGNNEKGTIRGAITVNIEETGCRPLKIGELYGGGNEAGYSIYGYKKVEDEWVPRDAADGLEPGFSATFRSPLVNVKSFTSIGNIYGGGYGETAKMVGSPTVNINVGNGDWYNKSQSVVGENATTTGGYPIPSHASGDIGAINNVYGGGNAAPVFGNTNVNIGVRKYEEVVSVVAGKTDVSRYYTRTGAGTTESPYVYTAVPVPETPPVSGPLVPAAADTTYYMPVLGADIRGNVYGGGNAADVTGDTNVVIGKEETTTP